MKNIILFLGLIAGASISFKGNLADKIGRAFVISSQERTNRNELFDGAKRYVYIDQKAAMCGSCGYFYNFILYNTHNTKSIWVQYQRICYFGKKLSTYKVKLDAGEKTTIGNDARNSDCTTNESTSYYIVSAWYAK